MKHKTKRLLSWLLALAMVFSLMPGMSFSASATTFNNEAQIGQSAPHKLLLQVISRLTAMRSS